MPQQQTIPIPSGATVGIPIPQGASIGETDEERSAASPIPPPKFTPPGLGPMAMHRSFLIGNPDKDIDSPAVQMEPVTNLGKGIASVTAPVIGHRVLQKVAPSIVGPGNLYEGEPALGDYPGIAGRTFAGAMVGPLAGEPLASAPETTEGRVSPIAKPSAVKTPGVIDRAAEVAVRRASHIPGVQAVKDADYIVRGPKAAPETPPIGRPAPIPETNGIPWGSGGQGPIDLRGKPIPQEAPAPIARPAPSSQAESTLGRMRKIAKDLPPETEPEPEGRPLIIGGKKVPANTDLTEAGLRSIEQAKKAKARKTVQ